MYDCVPVAPLLQSSPDLLTMLPEAEVPRFFPPSHAVARSPRIVTRPMTCRATDRPSAVSRRSSLERGVYVMPCPGPNDEFVLFAVTSRRRLLCEPVIVPRGANHVQAADDLWERLDSSDTAPPLHVV